MINNLSFMIAVDYFVTCISARVFNIRLFMIKLFMISLADAF